MRITLLLIYIFIGVFSDPYSLFIPKGFPTPFIPEDNQLSDSRVALGKKLFFDNMMSRDSSLSCASCHQPQFAFSDGRQKSVGIKGRQVSRNAPTLTNVAYQPYFLLDGLNPSLETQVKIPIHEHNEFDFHILLIAERMKQDSLYVSLSKDAYNSEPSPQVIAYAIACYERTLISGNSPYDQYFYQGNKTALNDSEIRGMNLFFDDLYCASCHGGFNFSDSRLTNNGLYTNYTDQGRARLTKKTEDQAIFKTPTLRNIGFSAPYMHDGSFESLEQVIDHYSSGAKGHFNQDPLIQPFDISQDQKQDLIAFLIALNDSSFVSND
ncbi:MAG: cytochrome c peroxidase [Flavobacteriales bacterium]